MLAELAVTNLGVIADLRVVLGPGLTAVTGETGAGKTMLVESIELLVGGRADPVLVRPGAAEATVEGRFVAGDDEVVLARVVPRDGRSRAYVNGRLAPAAALAELAAGLVDLHGQHAHQSLLSAASQRAALDAFAGIDLGALRQARAEVRRLDDALATLGGDERLRAREIDLLRFQVAELDAAGIDDPSEDDRLDVEEATLADAASHREAAAEANGLLSAEGQASDALARAIAGLSGRVPFEASVERLRALAVEMADVAGEVRAAGEAIADDPERLAAVRERRQRLRELRRKYGDTLRDVAGYRDEAIERLARLESHDEEAAAIDADRRAAIKRVARGAAAVGRSRRATAPSLASAVQTHLAELAMPGARLAVEVDDDDPGDDVRFLLAASRGAPLLPLAKVASGGELARTMLALRLVLLGARSNSNSNGHRSPGADAGTLIFDEVDAGIGGRSALAVGRALASLAAERQVLVVTHLPQVAAFADRQLAVAKQDDGSGVRARAAELDRDARVVELSRMLSGSPDSSTAHRHAAELLASAARERGR
jgi:DNA repair protein RecN (Recombination protein N)